MEGGREACRQLVLELLTEVAVRLIPRAVNQTNGVAAPLNDIRIILTTQTIASSPFTGRTRISTYLQRAMFLFQQLSAYLTETYVNDTNGSGIEIRQLDHKRIKTEMTSRLDSKRKEHVLIHQRALRLSRWRFLQQIHS